MWHRPLLIGWLICAPALVVAKNYSRLASDYQVGLGVAFSTGGISVPRSNVNVTITPVFNTDRSEYERSLASFRESRTKTQIDRGMTRFSLLLAPFEMPASYLQGLVPVGWAGPFGLWAPPDLPADIVQGLEQTLVRMNGTTLGRFQQEGLPLSTGGAADLLAKAQAARAAEPAPAPVAPVNTIGPPLKGYDPREANRPAPSNDPPPLKHIPMTAVQNRKPGVYICSWPSINPPTPPKPAPKPRLTMADYAKKAAQERAAFQVRKAKAAADSKAIFDWMVDGRKKREADIRGAWQKRREYVDSQVNRSDAVVADDPVEDGPSSSDGKEKWVVVHLHNRTDIGLIVTLHYWGGPTGDQYQRTHTVMLIPSTIPFRLALFAGNGWTVKNFRMNWTAVPGEYQNKVPLAY
jgi:hypothetical protein